MTTLYKNIQFKACDEDVELVLKGAGGDLRGRKFLVALSSKSVLVNF